ncbi:hypothetical protein MMC20_008110 [Loxospora ochrophaea]|nr:hypothetical protein [Loxospora ochrophaea]
MARRTPVFVAINEASDESFQPSKSRMNPTNPPRRNAPRAVKLIRTVESIDGLSPTSAPGTRKSSSPTLPSLLERSQASSTYSSFPPALTRALTGKSTDVFRAGKTSAQKRSQIPSPPLTSPQRRDRSPSLSSSGRYKSSLLNIKKEGIEIWEGRLSSAKGESAVVQENVRLKAALKVHDASLDVEGIELQSRSSFEAGSVLRSNESRYLGDGVSALKKSLMQEVDKQVIRKIWELGMNSGSMDPCVSLRRPPTSPLRPPTGPSLRPQTGPYFHPQVASLPKRRPAMFRARAPKDYFPGACTNRFRRPGFVKRALHDRPNHRIYGDSVHKQLGNDSTKAFTHPRREIMKAADSYESRASFEKKFQDQSSKIASGANDTPLPNQRLLGALDLVSSQHVSKHAIKDKKTNSSAINVARWKSMIKESQKLRQAEKFETVQETEGEKTDATKIEESNSCLIVDCSKVREKDSRGSKKHRQPVRDLRKRETYNSETNSRTSEVRSKTRKRQQLADSVAEEYGEASCDCETPKRKKKKTRNPQSARTCLASDSLDQHGSATAKADEDLLKKIQKAREARKSEGRAKRRSSPDRDDSSEEESAGDGTIGDNEREAGEGPSIVLSDSSARHYDSPKRVSKRKEKMSVSAQENMIRRSKKKKSVKIGDGLANKTVAPHEQKLRQAVAANAQKYPSCAEATYSTIVRREGLFLDLYALEKAVGGVAIASRALSAGLGQRQEKTASKSTGCGKFSNINPRTVGSRVASQTATIPEVQLRAFEDCICGALPTSSKRTEEMDRSKFLGTDIHFEEWYLKIAKCSRHESASQGACAIWLRDRNV